MESVRRRGEPLEPYGNDYVFRLSQPTGYGTRWRGPRDLTITYPRGAVVLRRCERMGQVRIRYELGEPRIEIDRGLRCECNGNVVHIFLDDPSPDASPGSSADPGGATPG